MFLEPTLPGLLAVAHFPPQGLWWEGCSFSRPAWRDGAQLVARWRSCLLPEGMLLKILSLVDEGRLPPTTFYVPTGKEELIGTAWASRSSITVRGKDLPTDLRCSHVRPHATFYMRRLSGLHGEAAQLLQ